MKLEGGGTSLSICGVAHKKPGQGGRLFVTMPQMGVLGSQFKKNGIVRGTNAFPHQFLFFPFFFLFFFQKQSVPGMKFGVKKKDTRILLPSISKAQSELQGRGGSGRWSSCRSGTASVAPAPTPAARRPPPAAGPRPARGRRGTAGSTSCRPQSSRSPGRKPCGHFGGLALMLVMASFGKRSGFAEVCADLCIFFPLF